MKCSGGGPCRQLVDGQVVIIDSRHYSSLPRDEARALAAQIPTVSEPTRPGPAATAVHHVRQGHPSLVEGGASSVAGATRCATRCRG